MLGDISHDCWCIDLLAMPVSYGQHVILFIDHSITNHTHWVIAAVVTRICHIHAIIRVWVHCQLKFLNSLFRVVFINDCWIVFGICINISRRLCLPRRLNHGWHSLSQFIKEIGSPRQKIINDINFYWRGSAGLYFRFRCLTDCCFLW
jgi:hypothetical protein